MKTIITSFTILIILTTTSFAQKSSSNVASIITGSWNIDSRNPIVSTNQPVAHSKPNIDSELLNSKTKDIKFDKGQFTINPSNKTGEYKFKGNSLVLQGVSYKSAYYSDDKFSLMRIVNPDLIYSYMLERKK